MILSSTMIVSKSQTQNELRNYVLFPYGQSLGLKTSNLGNINSCANYTISTQSNRMFPIVHEQTYTNNLVPCICRLMLINLKTIDACLVNMLQNCTNLCMLC